MVDYSRSDHRLSVSRRGGAAMVRLTDVSGVTTECALPVTAVDLAAVGDASALRTMLAESPVGVRLAALFPAHATDVRIARLALEIYERAWAAVSWERIISTRFCIVRTSEVRPRIAQIPFTFPMRILEVSPTQPIVAGLLERLFDGSHQEIAMLSVATTPDQVASLPSARNWPTVEVLHLRALEVSPTTSAALLKWLQPFSERYQTRLIVFECTEGSLGTAQRLAQVLIERAGPAVWVAGPDFTPWHDFYGFIAHDRPLDWMRAQLPPAALFCGAGREDLLRYSSLGVSLGDPGVVAALQSRIAASQPRSVKRVRVTVPRIKLAHQALRSAARSLRIPMTPTSLQLDFSNMQASKRVRFGAAMSTYLAQRGVYSDVDGAPLDVHLAQKDFVDVRNLAGRVAARAMDTGSLSRNAAAKIVSDKLQSIGTLQPTLSFEHHESDGMLPLAAKVLDARTLLREVHETAALPDAPRYVNTAFFRETPSRSLERLAQAGTRLDGRLLHFGVQIGQKDDINVTLGSSALLEEVARLPGGTLLELGITALDFEVVGDPVQTVVLPERGPSDLVTFAVRPLTQTTEPGVARLRLSIFHRNNLVQSFMVAAALQGTERAAFQPALARALGVALAEVQSVGEVGYLMRLEYSAGPIADAGAVPERVLAIVANESAGQKVVTIKGEELFQVTREPNLPESIRQVREALDAASETNESYRYLFESKANEGDPAALCDTLWNIATAGWRLYNLLVHGGEAQQAVRRRGEAGGPIHAAHIDASSVIPWSLIYDRRVYDRKTLRENPLDPNAPELRVTRGLCSAGMPAADGSLNIVPCGQEPGCLLHPSENARRKAANEPIVCAETVICPRRFWGYAAPIEVPAQQVIGVAGLPPQPIRTEVLASKPVQLVAGFNPNLSFYGQHKSELQQLLEARQVDFKTPEKPGRDILYDYLEHTQPDIVYFFCHALPTLIAADQTLGPTLDFGMAFNGTNTDDVFEAKDFTGKEWSHAPLVFLNACGTAGFSPYAPSTFIKEFIQGRKAAAVVGTEVTVWEVLATEFASSFLEGFLLRHTAGESLLRARRRLLAKNNPLGLVYTLYGSADLGLVGAAN